MASPVAVRHPPSPRWGPVTSRGSSMAFFSVPMTIAGSSASGRMAGVDGRGLDERLISLDIDHQLGVLGRSRFRHAVGARNVVARVMTTRAPKTSCSVVDPLVISSNNRGGKVSRQGGALVDALEHAFGGDLGQDLAGKTGRCETRRNNAQYFTRHRRSYHKTRMLKSIKKGWPAADAAVLP